MRTKKLLFAIIVVAISCSKTVDQNVVSSKSSDNATASYNTWSGWTIWKGEKVDMWFADTATADAIAVYMQQEYLDIDSVTIGNSTALKKTVNNSRIAIDLQDPCDPTGPPLEDFKVEKMKNGKYTKVTNKKTGKITIIDCGTDPGSTPTSFSITFTFPTSGNGYNIPDYNVTITIWEDGGEYVTSTIEMQPSGNGAYGEYTQETDKTLGITYHDDGDGGILTWNVNAKTDATLGFSGNIQVPPGGAGLTQSNHATFLMNMNGWLSLDRHFNPITGAAWLKPRAK